MISTLRKYGYFYTSLLLNSLLVVTLLTIIVIKFIFPNSIPLDVFKIISIIAVVPVIIAGIRGLKSGEITTDLLAAVALVFAFLAKEWYSAAFINLMLSSARIFDIWTQKRSQNLLEGLLKYRVSSVKVQENGSIKLKNLNDVRVGDLIIVNSGERIPIDGIIESGQASIDESTLTGESIPQTKIHGDIVYSPTLNTSGEIIIKVTKTASESTLSKIIQLVEEASIKKSKIVRVAAKFTKWYILITLVGSIIIYFFTGNLLFVLSVLLVVCADDIAVSIPLAFSVAIVRASERGILIKSADVLEKVSNINTIVTDKTGTLTSGRLKIIDVVIFSKLSKNDFIKYLAAAEAKSSHPISKPILEYAKKLGVDIISSLKSSESPGEGVEIEIDKKKVFVGKVDYLKKRDVNITSHELEEIYNADSHGLSVIALAINKNLAGILTFEDAIRPEAKNVVEATKKFGVQKWIMLTGDSKAMAKKVARLTGIDEIKTNLTPAQKLEFISQEKSRIGSKNLAMIGDGVNDAAALALSDIGIAMGIIGSDAAINAADISLMTDNLEKIPEIINLGRQTKQIVKRIFIIWAITNLVGLVLVFTKVLNPTGAATYNFLTDFIPILSALRLGIKK